MNKESLTEIYDFVEIGTADFETLIQSCDENAKGISVDPMGIYLRRLPNKPNVTKLQAAIVDDEELEEVDVYYVPEFIIRMNDLGSWLKGCNSVGKPHDLHVEYYQDPRAWHEGKTHRFKTQNLLEKGYVKVEKAEALTFSKLVKKFNIKKIRYLKTDTEGYDPKILNSMLDFYTNNGMQEFLPDRIYFEWNKHCDPEELKQIKARLESFGYTVGIKSKEDIHNRLAILNHNKEVE